MTAYFYDSQKKITRISLPVEKKSGMKKGTPVDEKLKYYKLLYPKLYIGSQERGLRWQSGQNSRTKTYCIPSYI